MGDDDREFPEHSVGGRRFQFVHRIDDMSNTPLPITNTGTSGTSRGALSEIGMQAALITAGAVIYFAVRSATEGSVATANKHGHDLLRFETALGLDIEARVQGLILDNEILSTAFNWVYIWGHWPAIAITLLWLHQRSPEQFLRLRNALFASGAIGVVIFVLYPVTPPRLLDVGIVDTVTERSNSYRVLQPPSLINKYAAMPSLHVGWNYLIGLAIITATQSRMLKVIGVLSPVAMIGAVVLTGNHYVIDAVAGLAVATLGWVVASKLSPATTSVPAEESFASSEPATARGCRIEALPDRRVVCPSASCSLRSGSGSAMGSTGITSPPSPISVEPPAIDDEVSCSR